MDMTACQPSGVTFIIHPTFMISLPSPQATLLQTQIMRKPRYLTFLQHRTLSLPQILCSHFHPLVPDPLRSLIPHNLTSLLTFLLHSVQILPNILHEVPPLNSITVQTSSVFKHSKQILHSKLQYITNPNYSPLQCTHTHSSGQAVTWVKVMQ